MIPQIRLTQSHGTKARYRQKLVTNTIIVGAAILAFIVAIAITYQDFSMLGEHQNISDLLGS